jgi:hypothetical protein
MAHKYNVVPNKTYATEKNADLAVHTKYGRDSDLVYIIMRTEDNRFFPVFVSRSALTKGVHFHFNIACF